MAANFRYGRCFVLAITLLLFGPLNVFAQTHTVVPDRQAVNTYASVADGDVLSFAALSGSSYCCEIITQGNANVFFSSSTVAVTHSSGTESVTGAFASSPPKLANSQARLCFIVPPGLTSPVPALGITISAGSPLSNLDMQCTETTLYGGFNTSVTDFNFLEITNTTDAEITGTITAVNVVPNPDVVVINGDTFTVTANSRTDVDIHTRAGAGAFGPIKVAHRGGPGALKAVLSQYNITSLSPLDFAPVAQDVAKTRSELAGPVK